MQGEIYFSHFLEIRNNRQFMRNYESLKMAFPSSKIRFSVLKHLKVLLYSIAIKR